MLSILIFEGTKKQDGDMINPFSLFQMNINHLRYKNIAIHSFQIQINSIFDFSFKQKKNNVNTKDTNTVEIELFIISLFVSHQLYRGYSEKKNKRMLNLLLIFRLKVIGLCIMSTIVHIKKFISFIKLQFHQVLQMQN
ncbi:hypothetical protein RFI_33726 [Reticulomyxa filosa]|uniref:Transmembrane protein n=1 Tax=Reticulomyxa filosa TaxID=46433 RepID=X6LQJ4_RETFI|nr:hypothetical protein RFI_33726 [Reticulomyxa filosa]|eukprot:ETO03676.1 hypothetical protein RFI_33726 [Reticulomyxa filosa]